MATTDLFRMGSGWEPLLIIPEFEKDLVIARQCFGGGSQFSSGSLQLLLVVYRMEMDFLALQFMPCWKPIQ